MIQGVPPKPAFAVGNALLELWFKHAAKFPDVAVLDEAVRALPVVAPSGVATNLGSLVETGICEPRMVRSIAARAGISGDFSAGA